VELTRYWGSELPTCTLFGCRCLESVISSSGIRRVGEGCLSCCIALCIYEFLGVEEVDNFAFSACAPVGEGGWAIEGTAGCGLVG
jgi:hypothetical protein